MIFILIEIVFQIVLIVYQSKTVYILNTINSGLISYAVEHSCSDGPMQAAFKSINDNISQDLTKAAVGLGFTVCCLVGLLLTMLATCSTKNI